MRRTALAAFLAVMLFLCLVPVISADYGYPYLMQDPAWWGDDSNAPQNKVFYWWSVGNSHLCWWAEDGLKDDVRQAISNWQSKEPSLCSGWRTPAPNCLLIEVGAPSDADVTFTFHTHMFPAVGQTWLGNGNGHCTPDTYLRACYWDRAEVWIQPTSEDIYNYAPGTRVAIIAHEIGHLFGLGERYTLNVLGQGACGADYSIMDGLTVDRGIVPCDRVTGPTDLDQQRFDVFWKQGMPDPNRWSAYGSGTSSATFYWHDGAYTEWEYHMVLVRADGMGGWQLMWNGPHLYDIGMQETAQDRSLGLRYSLNDRGDPAGTYRLCGWPRFVAFTGGEATCSPAVNLVR
jgi:hypothetical protein